MAYIISAAWADTGIAISEVWKLFVKDHDPTWYVGSWGVYVTVSLSAGDEPITLMAQMFKPCSAPLLSTISPSVWTPVRLSAPNGQITGYVFDKKFYEIGTAHYRCANCRCARIAHIGSKCMYDVTDARFEDGAYVFDLEQEQWIPIKGVT